jgi:hypothetical protein
LSARNIIRQCSAVAVYQSLLEWLTASTVFSYFSKTFRRLSRKFIIPRSPARVFLVVILFVRWFASFPWSAANSSLHLLHSPRMPHIILNPNYFICQRSCFIDSNFFCPRESVDHYEMRAGNVSNVLGVLGVSQVIDFRYFKGL